MTRNDLKMHPRLKKQREYFKNEIKRLKREMTSIKSPQITDEPEGGKRRGLDDKLAEIEEYELKVTQAERRMDEIENAIKSVPDELGREILIRYYIEGCTWIEIGLEKGYSDRQIKRFHEDLFDLRVTCPTCPTYM